MKLSCPRTFKLALFLIITGLVLFSFGPRPLAQSKTRLPSRAGHVNDFAGVVDPETRELLENILENLKQKSGIQLDFATVETTGGQDIFDFSRQLANDWGVGARGTTKKRLLLVLSVNEKAMFTQFSKSAQEALPEGILGQMSQRMRAFIGLGQFAQGLTDGVRYFVNALGSKMGFSLEEIERTQTAASASPEPIAVNATVESGPTQTATTVRSVNERPRPTSRNPKHRDVAAGRMVASQKATTSAEDEDEEEEVELTLTLPLDRRVTKLKEFLKTHRDSKAKPRALELLISAHAGLGDQKLKNGDGSGGVEQLMLAIEEAPANISEKLFSGVVSQIPLNLYLRGERAAAFKAAQNIEARFGADPKRLLTLAGFYLGIEQGDEAVRLAKQALTLAPDMAEAHHALGLGLHISLRLDEAAREYRKVLELEPNSKGTRRSLADLNRAVGKSEEALTLYREQVAADPTDKGARAGLVLSLLDLGKLDEGNKELNSALQDDPRNLALLTGAAYWFAAHNDSKQALEFGRKAVDVEPRYTWSQIALARALIAEKRPLEAERAIRFARQYGKFPTLDYELANVLASMGLYDEAVEALMQSFSFKDGQIETRLAGHLLTHASSFEELLSAERRASIFQFTPAETVNNANTLKALLEFAIVTNQQSESDKNDDASIVAAAKEFSLGGDDMRVYRKLYAASRLLRKGVGLQTAYDLTQSARDGVDGALNVPAVTLAVQADEFRDMRARSISSGVTPDIADAPQNVLSNILRGRIEDLSGWVLFNQDKPSEAIEHLKLAAGILPSGTPAWRTALWHLGTALDQSGNKEEALSYYIKSYNSGEPDAVRRGAIEQLYRKINGSLEGLDARIGAAPVAALNGAPSAVVDSTKTPTEQSANQPSASESPTPAPSPEATALPSAIADNTRLPSVGSVVRTTTLPETKTAEPETTPTPDATVSPSPKSDAPATEPVPAVEKSSASTTSSASGGATPAESPTPTTAQGEAVAQSSPTPSATQGEAVAQSSPTPGPDSSLPRIAAALRATIKIGGRIKDASNNGISNVVVVLISPRGTVLASTTDAEGNYSFVVSPSQRGYRVIPSKDGVIFEPLDKTLVGLSDDQKDLDFVGKQTAPTAPQP